MKLVWSPEMASQSYIDTVKSCKKLKELGAAELLSATAAGWNAKFIVESWSDGNPIEESVGLIIAARNTCGRHVCIVHDEATKVHYLKALAEMGVFPPPEVMVGDAETVVSRFARLDFLVVDCKLKEFGRVLRAAKVSARGAVLVCKNAWEGNFSGSFKWSVVRKRGMCVVRSVFLPMGNGLDIAYVGSVSVAPPPPASKRRSRWIKFIDQRSGEQHIFRAFVHHFKIIIIYFGCSDKYQ